MQRNIEIMMSKSNESKASTRAKGHKLPTLPTTSKITKRPLLRPAISSPYSGSSSQKIVYISAKTPFISAVKRVEKLLHLSDKRVVQSATQVSKQRRRRGEDEIVGIAREVEKAKDKGNKEEVVLKGTGKACGKVMELGLWFQQREEEYAIRLETGSVGAVEDVEFEEDGKDASAGADVMDLDQDVVDGSKKTVAKPMSKVVKREVRELEDGKKEVSETRIKQLSVLEVHVSLR